MTYFRNKEGRVMDPDMEMLLKPLPLFLELKSTKSKLVKLLFLES